MRILVSATEGEDIVTLRAASPEGRGQTCKPQEDMMKFRKKPVVIDAIRYGTQGENMLEVAAFIGKHCTEIENTDGTLAIFTLEGSMCASRGDWIIKGVAGEFYPCKPDIFEKTYEAV